MQSPSIPSISTPSSANDENLWSEEYFTQMTKDLQKNMDSLVNADPAQLDSLLEHLMNDVSGAPAAGASSTGNSNGEKYYILYYNIITESSI